MREDTHPFMRFSHFVVWLTLLCPSLMVTAWAGSAANSLDVPVAPHFFDDQAQAPLDAVVTPLSNSDGLRVLRVTFPSPVTTPFVANNTVVGFLYLPSGTGPFPAMIVLPEWLPRNLSHEEVMCEAMAHAGVAAFVMEEPYSLERRPVPHRPDAELLSGNLPQMVAGLRQTVLDARRCVDYLQSRPDIMGSKMGIGGISLGAILASLIAGVDPRLTVVLSVVGGSDIADIIWNSLFTRGIHQSLVAHGYTFGDLQTAMAPFEADRWLHGFDPANALMFNGRDDIFVHPWEAKDMAQALGGAPIVWLDTGHYGVALSSGMIEATGARFLRARFFPNCPRFHAPASLPAHTIKLGILLGGQEVASPALAYQVLDFDREGHFSMDAQLTLSGLSADLTARLNDSKSVGIEFPLFHGRVQPRPFLMFHVVL